MGHSGQDLRKLRQAAMAGDPSAAAALLNLYCYRELAADIKRNPQRAPRSWRMVKVLTAGTGQGDEPGPWEAINPKTGEIESDILDDPPTSRRGFRPRAPLLEE